MARLETEQTFTLDTLTDEHYRRLTMPLDFSDALAVTNRFTNIYEIYNERIKRHLRRMVRVTEIAEDLAQDTFVSAYVAFPRFLEDQNLKLTPWIYRIATNKALSHLRRGKFAAKSLEEGTLSLPSSIRVEHQVESELILKEILTDIEEEGFKGEAAHATLLLGMGYHLSEIMEIIGKPQGTIQSSVARYRKSKKSL